MRAVELYLVGDKKKQVRNKDYNNLVSRCLTQLIKNI